MVRHQFHSHWMRNKDFEAILVKSGNGGSISRRICIKHVKTPQNRVPLLKTNTMIYGFMGTGP